MENNKILNYLDNIEAHAKCLLDECARLREEICGDSSITSKAKKDKESHIKKARLEAIAKEARETLRRKILKKTK